MHQMFRVALAIAFVVLAFTPVYSEDSIEEIEDIEITEITPLAIENDALHPALLLGRIHPAVVHVPIGWLVLLVMIDTLGLMFGNRQCFDAGIWLLGGTAVAIVPAIITGMLLLESFAEVEPLALQHRNLAFAGFVLVCLALGYRLRFRSRLETSLKWGYLGLIYLAALSIMLAGHLGGKMVFGPNYLPF